MQVVKVNCIYNLKGAYCKNNKIKRSFFGIGSRLCCEYDTTQSCSLKKKHKKGKSPSPISNY